MIDTNLLLSITLSVISDFTNTVRVSSVDVPTRIQDIQQCRIGAPNSPLDVFLTGKNGASFWMRKGIITTFSSSNSFVRWHDVRPRSMFQGALTVNPDEAVRLAVKTVALLAGGRNVVAGIVPRVRRPGAPEDPAPFYYIDWRSTNDGMLGIRAFIEIDGRTGLVTHMDLFDSAFSDSTREQDIRNRVYTAPPKHSSLWQRQWEAPAKRVQPYPTAYEVNEAIAGWLFLCRRLGVDPGRQTNIDSVFWPQSWTETNSLISPAAHICVIQFSNRTSFASINGVAFTHHASDSCFVGFFEEMSREDRAQFRGHIERRWEDLARSLEHILVERVGIPSALIKPLRAQLEIRDPRDFDGLPLKRVVVGWENPLKAKRFETIAGGDDIFRAEFDLETGELKWIDLGDAQFIHALGLAQESERRSTAAK